MGMTLCSSMPAFEKGLLCAAINQTLQCLPVKYECREPELSSSPLNNFPKLPWNCSLLCHIAYKNMDSRIPNAIIAPPIAALTLSELETSAVDNEHI